MNREQTMVAEFHNHSGQTNAPTPSIPAGKVVKLRVDLIAEEFEELQEAFYENNLVEVADALGDLLYVVYGTALSCGIDMEPIFEEIHRSNMTKNKAVSDALESRDWTKVIKGAAYMRPQLKPILDAQMYNVYGQKDPPAAS